MSGSRAAALRDFHPPHTIFANFIEASEKASTYHILYVRHLLLQPVVGATVYRVTNARQQIADFLSQVLVQQSFARQIAHVFRRFSSFVLRRKWLSHLVLWKSAWSFPCRRLV